VRISRFGRERIELRITVPASGSGAPGAPLRPNFRPVTPRAARGSRQTTSSETADPSSAMGKRFEPMQREVWIGHRSNPDRGKPGRPVIERWDQEPGEAVPVESRREPDCDE
jgi:hypothetical protein